MNSVEIDVKCWILAFIEVLFKNITQEYLEDIHENIFNSPDSYAPEDLKKQEDELEVAVILHEFLKTYYSYTQTYILMKGSPENWQRIQMEAPPLTVEGVFYSIVQPQGITNASDFIKAELSNLFQITEDSSKDLYKVNPENSTEFIKYESIDKIFRDMCGGKAYFEIKIKAHEKDLYNSALTHFMEVNPECGGKLIALIKKIQNLA